MGRREEREKERERMSETGWEIGKGFHVQCTPFSSTENRGVSSSEDESQEMVNISLYSTSPEIMHSFAATEIKDTAQFHRYVHVHTCAIICKML